MSSLGDVGAGNTLGRYELLTPIAQGGMALVWAARLRGTRGFQKIVAIKTMLPSLSDDPQFEEMFLAEAELASKIRHPNVCEILDLGEEDATLYIVMEWVNGEPLTALMRAGHAKGEIPPSVCTKLMRDAALGLHAAHEVRNEEGELVGLVHRDVSPHNILVGHDGNVKIVDFGIAKATTANDASKTQAGQMKGKVPYMAPEQARGGAIDRRTDIFALGIVLYQMVTAKHPFRAEDDIATLKRLCDRIPLPRASSIVQTLSKELDDTIAKALSKDPALRYQTMADFAAALDHALGTLVASGDSVDPRAFVLSVLGHRAEKRRRTIKEAIRVADERAKNRPRMEGDLNLLGDDAMSSIPSSVSGASLMTPSAGSFGSGLSQLSNPTSPTLTGPHNDAPPSSTGSATGADLGSSDAGVYTDRPPQSSPRRRRTTVAILSFLVLATGIGVAGLVLSRRNQPERTGTVATTTPSTPSSTATVAAATETTTVTATTTETAQPEAGDVIESASASASASARWAGPRNVGPRATASAVLPRATQTAAPATGTATGNGLPRVRDPGF